MTQLYRKCETCWDGDLFYGPCDVCNAEGYVPTELYSQGIVGSETLARLADLLVEVKLTNLSSDGDRKMPLVVWPTKWPVYKQACFGSWNDCCDMVVGPCRCGAWHKKGEFTFRNGVLRRYGRIVPVLRGISAEKLLSR